MIKKSTKIQIPSARSEDQPASRKLVYLVRDEVLEKINGLSHRMDAGFSELRSELRSSNAELRSEMRATHAELRADSARMQILLEEQNSNSRIVLEGLQALWQRQVRIESLIGK